MFYPQFLITAHSFEEIFNGKLFLDRLALGDFVGFAGFEAVWVVGSIVLASEGNIFRVL